MSTRELASELRTRLQYAMVKVHNGWERESLCDLETLVRQREATTQRKRSPAHTAEGKLGFTRRSFFDKRLLPT